MIGKIKKKYRNRSKIIGPRQFFRPLKVGAGFGGFSEIFCGQWKVTAATITLGAPAYVAKTSHKSPNMPL